MTLEQLTGRYWRLRQELAAAYEAQPWHSGQIDRLVDQIAETERAIGARTGGTRGLDEPASAFAHHRGGGE